MIFSGYTIAFFTVSDNISFVCRMKSKRVSRIHENRSFLEKHGISTQQFEEAVSNIQSFILFDNAFPSNHEQYVEICELIRKFPHHRNTKDLMSKVSIKCLLIPGISLG